MGGELGSGGDPDFGKDVFDVGFDGCSSHEEAGADLGVGHSFGHEGQDLFLGGCQAGPAVAGSFAFTAGPGGVLDSFGPRQGATFGFGGVGRRSVQPGAGRGERVVDRRLLEVEAPAVVAFVAQSLGRAVQPQALGPAFRPAGGGGESFEGVDDDETQTVIGRGLQRVVPGVSFWLTAASIDARTPNAVAVLATARTVVRAIDAWPAAIVSLAT